MVCGLSKLVVPYTAQKNRPQMDIDVKRFDDVTRALTGLADYTVVEAVSGDEEGLL